MQELAKNAKKQPENGTVEVKKEIKQEVREAARCRAPLEWRLLGGVSGQGIGGSFPVSYGVSCQQ